MRDVDRMILEHALNRWRRRPRNWLCAQGELAHQAFGLVDRGWMRRETAPPGGSGDAAFFSVTDAGRAALEGHPRPVPDGWEESTLGYLRDDEVRPPVEASVLPIFGHDKVRMMGVVELDFKGMWRGFSQDTQELFDACDLAREWVAELRDKLETLECDT